MSQNVDIERLKRLKAQFERLYNADDPATMAPLLEALARIAVEGNRQGIMQGLDRHGDPMVPVTYRPGKPVKGFARRSKGFGTQPRGLTINNLTTKQYQSLTGPPLAPRGLRSRVIQNFRIGGFNKTGSGEYGVQFDWQRVLNAKGQPFLRAHFKGSGRLPKRDLRGIRPRDVREMAAAMVRFYRAHLRLALAEA